MTKAEEYEAHSQLAEAEAGQAGEGEHRQQLLTIAAQWRRLARQMREDDSFWLTRRSSDA
jgi:hypothetical protein